MAAESNATFRTNLLQVTSLSNTLVGGRPISLSSTINLPDWILLFSKTILSGGIAILDYRGLAYVNVAL